MRMIDRKIIEELYKQANISERKRAHYQLHYSHQDKVQRLLIALIKGSYVEPHFHELHNQWEMFSVLDGCIRVCIYDEGGDIINTFLAGPGENSSLVEFSPGEIHSVECISNQTLMLEIKEGPFDPNYAKAFPKW
ncbi:WbuC family cupin fold metalloprotein [Budviciaceae bacterium BWR-B9]|uniref:WbuC family cupin fold metalloprotein n=1 Tax=Limnobaculum allomyrinae TaxID=2791986 RepID=A0ABS1IU29_9GAMM|nr:MULTISPECIES: WbuC family cupin fold metalloprotein [Limnobaculum]MBK5145051.1 WbuC family cupin fold metalloprotein [Limnobaculum allomyrinae]MBV7692882.1 WbuC family cupin fold metalloprotein [Limnobaculum sp. M2-1]